MNRNRLNLLLLALVTGLTLTVLLTREEEELPVPVLADLNTDQVNSIRISYPDQPAIELRQQDQQWQLTAPVSAVAEAIEVSALTDLAALTSTRQLAAAELDLAQLGLAPPKFEIRLNDQLLQFGGIEPLEYQRYVMVGDTVHLVSDPPSAALDEDFTDLISKQLVPPGRKLTAVKLPDLLLSQDDPGWALSPPQSDVSADQLQQLADAWSSARALWQQAPEDDVDYSDQPQIELSLDDGSQIQLRLYAREPQLILARPAAQVHYHLSKALADELLQLPPAAEAVAADLDPVAEALAPAEADGD